MPGSPIGIAELHPGDEAADLFRRADAALVDARAKAGAQDALGEQPAADRI